MSTTNNTTTNYTVENLVAKYREYVSKHCSYGVNACEGNNGKMIEVCAPISPDANADEQLLVTLYSCVTGSEADKNVMTALSGYVEKYQKEALTEEEFVFLCNNFKELVAYEFSHRTEWGWKSTYKSNEDIEYLPHQSHHTHTHIARTSLQFEIIKLLPKPEVGQTIFIADSGYCDVAMLFPECIIKGYTIHNHFDDDNETWALGQIRLYAAGIKSEILPTQKNGLTPEYMSDVDYAIWGMSRYSSFSFYEGVEMLLQHMKPNGKIFISMERSDAAGGGKTLQLRKKLVEGRLVDSIFSFEEKDEFLSVSRKTIFISASKSVHHAVRMQIIPGDTFEIPSNMLDANNLWPGFYLANKPKNGIPLSEIASYEKMISVYNILEDEDVTVDAIKDELVISDRARKILNMFSVATPADMTTNYKEANLCHANLKESGNSVFEGRGGWIKIIIKPCVLLYGKNDRFVAGFVDQLPSKEKIATLLDSEPTLVSNEGMATLDFVPCLIPKEDIDVRYLTALLLSPEIKEQIITLCEGDINDLYFPLIMDKIIVPNHTERERLSFLLEANYNALVSSRKEMSRKHEHYIKAVRMRKHALTQSLSSVKSMFNALNNYRNLNNGKIADNAQISRVKRTTVKEAFEFIDKNIKDMMPALEHIADVEYSFNKSEWIDPERFIEDYISKKENGWLNFKPSITWVKGHNQAKTDLKDQSTGQLILKKGDAVDMLLFPLDALERVFNNIVSNAQAHGFTDSTRKDYEIRFSWHTDGIALIVEIENNGTAIPSDWDVASLLEYGVSSALHQNGHNGIGCNEIDDIMRRYDGKVEIVSSPEKDFTVKYVLTFNRSNIIKYI